MLQQLTQSDYRGWLLKNKSIAASVNELKIATKNNWFNSWSYADKEIDNSFIYEEIRKILLPSRYFKLNTKRIYNEKKELIEKIKTTQDTQLLTAFLAYLIGICIEQEILSYLKEIKHYLKRPTNVFLRRYSKNQLFVKTWDRNPWIDYARSDELYACTSIGETTDTYAPAFHADVNMNSLDIYSNELRIGRINLFLVKNSHDEVLLLADCIDGSDRLMRNKTRLDYLLESILSYANYLGLSKVFFNTDLMFNNTPKLFTSHLRSNFENEQRIYVRKFITEDSQKMLMPFPIIAFTESLKEKGEGMIVGFLVDINKAHVPT